MPIEAVFAKDNGRVPLPSGNIATVQRGQHWPKTDQVVQLAPGLFTDDPRYGLVYSEAPPGYDAQLNEIHVASPDGVEDASAEPEAEQATAAPGEKRSVRRPKQAAED